MLRNRLDIQLRNVCLIFRVYSWLQSLWTPWTPFAPSLEPLEYTAESRDRTGSQHDIQCSEPAAVARGQKCGAGSRRCELSVPTSAVLPYASGVGGLSRRLLSICIRSCWICFIDSTQSHGSRKHFRFYQAVGQRQKPDERYLSSNSAVQALRRPGKEKNTYIYIYIC